MILHLIRHTKPLIEPGVCYGQLDVSCESPSAAAERLRGELPAGLPVWTSPLQRCRRLAEALHPAPMADARLAEMHFGEWEGRRWDDIPRGELDAWAANKMDYGPPGGESPRVLLQRVLSFVSGLTEPEAVVVTHAGVIRVLQAFRQNLPPKEWPKLQFEYGCLVHLEL